MGTRRGSRTHLHGSVARGQQSLTTKITTNT